MMEYDGDLHIPKHYLLAHASIDGTLAQYLCGTGVTSFAISETQKFGHVTYFWNGNNSGYVDEALEKYVEVPSDRVPFDQRPWMKAAEITDEVIAAIRSGDRKFIRLNYANGDMVGHTGVPAAVRISVEAVDLELGRLLRVLERAGGVALVLADHGNADLMFTEKNGVRTPHVAHTLNPVPCAIKDYSGANSWKLRPQSVLPTPGLSNIAATLCILLGYEPPGDYDPSLIALD
jgi:2,3-bisphosphoglycerate-independent phosphoglycerate mutase